MRAVHIRGRYAIAPAIVLGLMLLACCPCAFALNPTLDVAQYAHTSWKIRDGFPKGQITSIAQTQDGYLWLGTEFGLVRFDGIKHIPWQWPQDQQFPSSLISGLLATPDGTLWIGTLQGLASWKDGKLTQYPELAGRAVFKIVEDHEGTIWVSGVGATGGRICAIRSGSIRCYGEDGRLGRGVFGLFADSKGNIWAGVKDGLWRWTPGTPKFFPLPGAPDGIQGLGEDYDGTLLIGWNGGIQRFVDGKTEPYPLSGAVGQFWGRRLLHDRDGGLWIGTANGGLVHVHQGRTDVFAPSDGLSGPDVYSLFEDREGNIWVSTIDGLDRFRNLAVATFTAAQGLPNSSVLSVLADRDGSVWFATRGGLSRWINGQITRSPTGSAKSEGKSNLTTNSLFQDDSGRIWVSTQAAFGYLDNDHFISVSGVPGGVVTGIAQDTAGGLWIANEQVGLIQLLRASVAQQIPWPRFGTNGHASTLAADPSQGGIWIGFHLGGIAYFIDGQVRASYAAADGLGDGRVNGLLFDKRGALWVSTAGGLSRLKDGRISTLSSKNGLPCDAINWAMEDDAHSYWLYTACGLVRIAGTELDAWAAGVDQDKGAKRTIQATVFDLSDGVRSLAAGGHFHPQVAKSLDGRLWFLPWDGVSIIDPRNLAFNQLPPPVHVEQITVDRKTYDPALASGGGLSLPPSIRDLQIDYTALSLVAPEKIRFRYKLEEHDRDWQDVGNRRQAFYTDLPPGNYRFRVMACNNSGVWNEAGTFLDFSIAPAYYQTTWFKVAGVLLFLLVLGGLYQLRGRRVAGQVRALMEERLDERERIARDLHDTLLQSVQGLILKFHAVSKQIPPDAAAHNALEKTLDHADQVLAEGRDRVRNLRATAISIDDLPAAFKRVTEETPQGRKATFKTVVEGNVRKLHPLVQEESYCIGREAIVNALTHSGGRHVEVEITYDPRQFRLRVRDDGHGIDTRILEEGGRPDHWGMQGMRERANKIGAELKLWSGHETGTEVELTVPGTTAYQADGASVKRSWFRRSLGRDL